ncbi:MAG: glycosyltransferase family 2 protein [Patescibacteria group bacterium]|jgi:hypothetical protein
MSGTNPDISAIVVSWNVRTALERCLHALSKSEGISFEVIVIDNASHDGTQASLASLPNSMYVLNRKNLGFATAVTQGVARAKGRNIILINPDVVVYQDTLRHASEILDADGSIGVLGGKVLNEDGTIQRSVHRFPGLSDQAIILSKLSTFFFDAEPLQKYRAIDFSYDDAADVEQVEGALFAFRRKIYDQLGGFDRTYFLWFEEVDFCKRASERKLRIVYNPNFCAMHLGGLSTIQLWPLRRHLLYQTSMLRYFKKFHSPAHLLLLPSAILGTGIALLVTLLPQKLFRRFVRPTYAAK